MCAIPGEVGGGIDMLTSTTSVPSPSEWRPSVSWYGRFEFTGEPLFALDCNGRVSAFGIRLHPRFCEQHGQ